MGKHELTRVYGLSPQVVSRAFPNPVVSAVAFVYPACNGRYCPSYSVVHERPQWVDCSLLRPAASSLGIYTEGNAPQFPTRRQKLNDSSAAQRSQQTFGWINAVARPPTTHQSKSVMHAAPRAPGAALCFWHLRTTIKIIATGYRP
jgi:hypothetical protein